MSFLRAIRAALPEDGIYVEEVTQVGFASRLAFTVHAPRTFLTPGQQDTLGWGYGTALGAQAAAPGRKVVLATGDGGFMFQAAELATAMQHRLSVVVVVFDDGAFGNVRRIQEPQYGNRLIACDLTNPDFVKFAESFGWRRSVRLRPRRWRSHYVRRLRCTRWRWCTCRSGRCRARGI